ncbi:ABC transporter ATP-binding protein [Rhodanobacter denitrificans]|uniref:ATP-binding cassette domain-containing protein n=1 Tax=Rhodanobacter denitrificans TaxID=666685 RepID=UPI001F34A86B|nr:ABC transporter ATP-binding protein [Rhodanobacter denitrificans]UJJ59473.1 ABC transporter ATP-binding protein/permease [Rhodanobacter denitrificans]
MPDEPSPAQGHTLDLLRSLARTLGGSDLAEIAAYVALSLAAALVGSLAAVLLVPLVQPGHALQLAGGMFDVGGGVEMRAAVFVAATAAFAVLRWLVAWLGARLTSRYGMTRRRLVHARLVDAPLASLADATSAEIANVLTYNVETLTQGFAALLQLLVAGITTIVSLGFAFWVSPPLMLTAPLLAGFALVASRIFGREQSQVGRRYVADMTRLFWLSEDFPRRLRHIRSFGRGDAEKESYGAISAALGHGYRRQLELVAAGRLVLELLAAAAIAAVLVLAYRWHGVDPSSLIAVCLLLGRLLPYLVSTRQSFQQLRSAVPAFGLWQRYMDLDTIRSPATPSPAGPGTDRPALHIERIRLAPPLAGLDVRQVSLRPGELTLIRGDSGIGKSSLVDVLAGMGVPGVFAARVDGHAIGFGEYRELVRHGAYVSQGVRPWQHSVRECLRWAAPEAGAELMQAALQDVGLDRRLAGSLQGLDTALHSTASRLSGGELQRLLLAQVILRRPFLAVLDEATSALDAASEIQVLAAMKRRLPQTILVVVSHRASVAAVADQCLSIDGDLVATMTASADPCRAAALEHGGRPHDGAR